MVESFAVQCKQIKALYQLNRKLDKSTTDKTFVAVANSPRSVETFGLTR